MPPEFDPEKTDFDIDPTLKAFTDIPSNNTSLDIRAYEATNPQDAIRRLESEQIRKLQEFYDYSKKAIDTPSVSPEQGFASGLLSLAPVIFGKMFGGDEAAVATLKPGLEIGNKYLTNVKAENEKESQLNLLGAKTALDQYKSIGSEIKDYSKMNMQHEMNKDLIDYRASKRPAGETALPPEELDRQKTITIESLKTLPRFEPADEDYIKAAPNFKSLESRADAVKKNADARSRQEKGEISPAQTEQFATIDASINDLRKIATEGIDVLDPKTGGTIRLSLHSIDFNKAKEVSQKISQEIERGTSSAPGLWGTVTGASATPAQKFEIAENIINRNLQQINPNSPEGQFLQQMMFRGRLAMRGNEKGTLTEQDWNFWKNAYTIQPLETPENFAKRLMNTADYQEAQLNSKLNALKGRASGGVGGVQNAFETSSSNSNKAAMIEQIRQALIGDSDATK